MQSVILSIIRIIPRPLGLRIFRLLGLLLYYLLAERRVIAAINLEIVYGPDMSPARKAAIIKENLKNSLALIYDFLKIPQLPAKQQAELIEIHGEEHLREALALGKGVMAVSAHFGNFPLLIAAMACKGYDVHVVIRHFKSVWADKLYTDILDRFGIGTFPKNHVAPNILKILKSGGIVGYVLDQNMKYESGIFVDFFGKKACTLKGLATFAGRYGSPIIPAFIISHPLGKHHIHIEKPFIPDDAKVMKTRDEEITQYFTGMIEDWVRRYPEQWVWFHGRWKTRPAGEAPVYPKRTKRLKQLRNWCRVHYNAFCRGKGMDKDA